MNLNIQLFAAARDAANRSPVQLDLPTGATVKDLKDRIVEDIPNLKAMSGSLLFAVNNEYAADDQVLTESDEVACFPPVSGG